MVRSAGATANGRRSKDARSVLLRLQLEARKLNARLPEIGGLGGVVGLAGGADLLGAKKVAAADPLEGRVGDEPGKRSAGLSRRVDLRRGEREHRHQESPQQAL